MAHLSFGGSQITNNTGSDQWFNHKLYLQWDDEDPFHDPCYPVYFDTAIFDGPEGNPSLNDWGWKGAPFGAEQKGYWELSPNPFSGDEYTNPVPEPATILIVGLGAFFARKRKLHIY